MNKPSNYDSVTPAHMGEYEALEPGGYICTIKQAKTEKSKNGNEMLVLLFDIAEGEKKGFYEKQYNGNTQSDKKWKGVFRQVTEGESTKFFKGVIKSLEESNSGFTFDFDEKKLKGKMFGGIFGREEFFNIKTGDYQFSTKLMYIRSVDAIKNGKFETPKDKLADRSNKPTSNTSTQFATIDPTLDDEDLPF